MTWDQWLSVIAASFAVAAFVAAVAVFRKLPPRSGRNVQKAAIRGVAPEPGLEIHIKQLRAAIVANPTKNGIDRVRDEVFRQCEELGWDTPLWLETTKEDPGAGQAREAIRAGVDVVIAAGGDGTVRSVAQSMANSGIPMGMLPAGTGNLFARNLDLPMTGLEDLVRRALLGKDRPLDIGWVDALLADGTMERSHPFLVIAGMGFDAQMVADTSDQLKARVGWVAYFMAGLRHLHGQRIKVKLKIDSAPVINTKVRTVLIGNCGKLPGNLTLIPDAKIDDGWLDVAAIDPRGGLVGWSVLTGEILTQGITEMVTTARSEPMTPDEARPSEDARPPNPRRKITMDHLRGKSITVVSDEAHYVELDGDIIGKATRIHARVDHRALIVRL